MPVNKFSLNTTRKITLCNYEYKSVPKRIAKTAETKANNKAMKI